MIIVPDEDDVPFDLYVAQVLEIIPDVLPAHVFSLLEQYYPNSKDKVVETVLHVLFEDPDYPKADTKGKRKRDEQEEERYLGRTSGRAATIADSNNGVGNRRSQTYQNNKLRT